MKGDNRNMIQRVIAILSPVEADLVRQLRGHKFGKAEIVIKNGVITVIHFSETRTVSEKGGLELKDSVAIVPGSEEETINKLIGLANGSKER